MDKLPPLFNLIEVTIHRDENGRLYPRTSRPTDVRIARYLFITESPRTHPVHNHQLEALTERLLDDLTTHTIDTEHFATDYEFTDEEAEELGRFPETITLGSGLLIPQPTTYLRSKPQVEESSFMYVQRKTLCYTTDKLVIKMK